MSSRHACMTGFAEQNILVVIDKFWVGEDHFFQNLLLQSNVPEQLNN
jgi:hypothetical protein